jgi:hypothetical protein
MIAHGRDSKPDILDDSGSHGACRPAEVWNLRNHGRHTSLFHSHLKHMATAERRTPENNFIRIHFRKKSGIADGSPPVVMLFFDIKNLDRKSVV